MKVHDAKLFVKQNNRIKLLKNWYELAILPNESEVKNILHEDDIKLLQVERTGEIKNPSQHIDAIGRQIIFARQDLNKNLPLFHDGPHFPELLVRPSQIQNAGLGLYTNESLLSGQTIAYYSGHRHDYLSQKKIKDKRYLLQLGCSDRFVDPEPCLDVKARYINDPINENVINVEFVPDSDNWRANIRCTRDIRKNEELFISYGEKYWMLYKEEGQTFTSI